MTTEFDWFNTAFEDEATKVVQALQSAAPRPLAAWMDRHAIDQVVRAVVDTAGWRDRAHATFTEVVGKAVPILPLHNLVDKALVEVEPAVWVAGRHLQPKTPAWLVLAPEVHSDADAAKLGARLFRALIARRNVAAHVPLVHDLPLLVGYPTGATWVAPPQAAPKAKQAPTATEQKDAVLARLRDVFGRGVRIIGSEAQGYRVAIKPTLRSHRFPEITTRDTPLGTLDMLAASIIQRYGHLT